MVVVVVVVHDDDDDDDYDEMADGVADSAARCTDRGASDTSFFMLSSSLVQRDCLNACFYATMK